MKQASTYLVAGIATVALLAGLSIGYYLTPEYKLSMYDKNGMDLGAADRTLDLRYLNAMAAHHRGAILLAEQAARESKRPEMTALAAEIQANEPKLIEELYGWKKNWYDDTRIVRDPVVAELGQAGETFDLRFLNALIAHHEAGIVMAQDVLTKSSRAEVLDNANAVQDFLENGILALEKMRKDWYNI